MIIRFLLDLLAKSWSKKPSLLYCSTYFRLQKKIEEKRFDKKSDALTQLRQKREEKERRERERKEKEDRNAKKSGSGGSGEDTDSDDEGGRRDRRSRSRSRSSSGLDTNSIFFCFLFVKTH